VSVKAWPCQCRLLFFGRNEIAENGGEIIFKDKVWANQAMFLGSPEKVESIGKKPDESNNQIIIECYQQGLMRIRIWLWCRLFLGEKKRHLFAVVSEGLLVIKTT